MEQDAAPGNLDNSVLADCGENIGLLKLSERGSIDIQNAHCLRRGVVFITFAKHGI